MAVYFFDSSALVKRYSLEDGRRWVQAITDPDPAVASPIYIARIAGAETIAAFMKKVRDRKILEVDAARFISDFRIDFDNQYQIRNHRRSRCARDDAHRIIQAEGIRRSATCRFTRSQ